MKSLTIILAMISGMVLNVNHEGIKVWAVRKDSKISILGTSNVNRFDFELSQYNGNDTIIAYEKGQTVQFKKGVVRLAVNDFKNPNPLLTKDFRKTVKAKDYPDIVMQFINWSGVPGVWKDQKIPAQIEITLAGRSRILPALVCACRSGDTITITGTQSLSFSDFGLTAPTNVLGFINVRNELVVNFQLSLKVVNEI